MKLYFALSTDARGNQPLVETNIHYCLASYYYFNKGASLKIIKDLGLINEDTFWDSGAFSAFNSGKAINLRSYCKFIKDNDLKIYASLDDIGSPQKSLDNYNYMVTEGLNPLPCFHIGESIEFLDHIIDKPYIALGGMVMSANIENWLDSVFNYIFKKAPAIKIHGFGMTDSNLILKYPWHSIDSSSWVGCVRFARFSKWNENSKNFISIPADEYFRGKNIFYISGDPIIGESRKLMIIDQINQFKMMEQYLLNKKNNKDYNYITAQQTLF